MKVAVKIRLKSGILDPQGKTVHKALEHLGYNNVSNVRIGKLIEFEVDSNDENAIKEMADRVLANPVMETYEIEVEK